MEFLQQFENAARPDPKAPFSKDLLITKWNERDFQPIKNILFEPAQQDHINKLFRTIQYLDPTSTERGKATLAWRTGTALLTLGGAAIPIATGGTIPTSAKTGVKILGGLLGLRQLAKILVNPETARMAAKLPTLPPTSSAAKETVQQIFKLALRGEQIQLEGAGYGSATIQEDGTVKPN
jgi:hypothetical protein